MAALRTSLLVLAVMALALGGAGGTAYAQLHPQQLITCTASATPAQSRAEGIAEMLGDIIIVCTSQSTLGGIFPPVLNFNANLSVTLNVNVTNNRDFGQGSAVTDAILVVDETFGTPSATSDASGILNVFGAVVPKPQYGTRAAVNTLAWNGIKFPAPWISTNQYNTILRITNMRGNVSQLGIPSGEGSFPTSQVTAYVAISSQTAIPMNNNVLIVGVPFAGLATRIRGRATGGDGQEDPTLPIVALQCLTQFVDSDGNIRRNANATGTFPHAVVGSGGPLPKNWVTTFSSSDPAAAFSIRLSEGFASAFKTLGVPTTTPGSALAEDGFPTPPSGINGGGATQGTRFILRFYNVPNGVRLASPTTIDGTPTHCAVPDTATQASDCAHVLRITKVTGTDANGAGPLNTGGLTPSAEVTITGGFGYVIYEVVDSNPFVVENVVVPIWVAYRQNTANDLPAVGTLQASAAFAPLSTVTEANKDAPEPRFVDTGSSRSMYSIARCTTNLLFPFVTNQGGFDTGLAISNTTRDDKGTTAQAGACTLYYFGSTTGGGAAPPQQTSAVIPAGGQIVWTLSGGNSAANIAATQGFQGYLMALCQFQFAHGFAFITDGFGGVPTIAEGYLALVVPWNGVSGGRAAGGGESLGH